MIISIISFTINGLELEKKIINNFNKIHEIRAFTKTKQVQEIKDIYNIKESLSEWTRKNFEESDALIFIGACGIAVRSIAPYVNNKLCDPAVIVIDEMGRNVISLMSGHFGGANELAIEIAEKINGNPVITTATDVNNTFAVDVFAKKNNLIISNKDMIKHISSSILAGEKIGFICNGNIKGKLPNHIVLLDNTNNYCNQNINVSVFKEKNNNFLNLIPKVIHIGIGCRKGTDSEKLKDFILNNIECLNIDFRSIEQIASIDLKINEKAIIELAQDLNVTFVTYSKEELMRVKGDFSSSEYVLKVTGVDNVCERSAVLSSGMGKIMKKKISYDGMTMAVAIRNWEVRFE